MNVADATGNMAIRTGKNRQCMAQMMDTLSPKRSHKTDAVILFSANVLAIDYIFSVYEYTHFNWFFAREGSVLSRDYDISAQTGWSLPVPGPALQSGCTDLMWFI